MTEEQATATTYAISIKLPDFWLSDPELWFAQVEASFEAQKITQEQTKFIHVVRVLPAGTTGIKFFPGICQESGPLRASHK